MKNFVCHYRPAPAHLGLWVDSIWMVENPDSQPKPVVVLPDGRIDIHFSISMNEPFQISLAGIDTKPSYTEVAAGSRFCGISFFPIAAEYLLQVPVGELLDNRVRLADNFWGIQESDIGDFEIFNQKILSRLTQLDLHDVDSRKRKMFTALHNSQGTVSVSELVSLCHWSSRQINRYFNQWLGLSVKTYSSILRFRASFSTLKAGKLFPESDFADQSHFIKEIKKYSGHTPKQLYKNQDDRFIQLSLLR